MNSARLPIPSLRSPTTLASMALMAAMALVSSASAQESPARTPDHGLAPVPAVVTAPASVAPPPAPPIETAVAPVGPGGYASRDDVARFVVELMTRHPTLDQATVVRCLEQARYQPSVAKLVMPPKSAGVRNWQVYRSRMVDPLRVRSGQAFMARYTTELAEAERQSGVPAHIVAGIIGVETIYGRNKGNFRAVDALATLAFDFPKGRSDRSAFFRSELEALFVLAAQSHMDPLDIRGSYAGALGWPQFMPSSWLKYAVDFDGDGRVDLLNSPVDAIGSVANYLAVAGQWQKQQATHYRVQPPTDEIALATLLKPDILPTFTPARFAELGGTLEPLAQRHPGKLALIELRNGLDNAPGYVAGTENFYAVTRYNWSSFYAMAVIELGEALRSGMSVAERSAP